MGIAQPDLGGANLSELWDIPSGSGYSPLAIERYTTLMEMDGGGRVSADQYESENSALDLLAVRYVVVPRIAADLPELKILLSDASRWQIAESTSEGLVFENLRVMPWAWLVPEVITLSAEEVLAAAHGSELPDQRTWNPRETALVESPVATASMGPPGPSQTRIVSRSETELEAAVQTENGAFLVLSEPYFPGWRATIDGVETEIHRTNYALRGVQVPPGDHTVRMEYRPDSFAKGVAVSTASVGLLLLIVGLPFLAKVLARGVRRIRAAFAT
jgi:hypothetical protein